MIRIKDLNFSFDGAESPVLRRVNLQYSASEFALICGPTGSGKSTLLKAINGLIPHFSNGTLSGEVWLNAANCSNAKPHQLAHLVGFVNQQPEAAFVADTVIEELAFGMEQLGFEPAVMRRRIDDIAARFELSQLLNQPLTELSGGQQQRVAIAAALVAGQRVLLLDEPTSALDAHAAAELVGLLRSLATDLGITVLLAEHRIERIISLVDSVTVIHGDGSATKAKATDGLDQLLRDYRMVPPVIELGQKLGWDPLALSIETARKQWQLAPVSVGLNGVEPASHGLSGVALTASGVSVNYGNQTALKPMDLGLRYGQITAVVGPNGSGKTSLLWALQGQLEHSGQVRLANGHAPGNYKPLERLNHIALVPQWAADLLMAGSISAELAESDSFAQVSSGTTAQIFSRLAGRIDPARHPRDLSAGQQLALVLAIQLAKDAPVLLLDEPTRGLDYESKRQLASALIGVKNAGKAVLIASHDVEFLALVADRVLRLEAGTLAASGPAEAVLGSLGHDAPQIWQVTGTAIRLSQLVTS